MNCLTPILDQNEELLLKLYGCRVQAGFPSPADDYIEKGINIHELVVKKPAATYLVRAEGDSMIGAGILHDSYVVVDRSLTVRNGLICVAMLGGGFTVKRYFREGSNIFLMSDNPDQEAYKPICINIEDENALEDFEIQGVVRGIVTLTV